MSKKKLEEFIIKLSEDSQLNQSYLENPQAVMEQMGLEQTEIKAILSGDQKQVQKIIGEKAHLITIIKMMKD
ncbi:hypothetical protein [Kangiella sp.]|uniref:hypothetical protein n=1 Tax=Kangiella sp. TaxID=1920245 RepID=UPI003A93656D